MPTFKKSKCRNQKYDNNALDNAVKDVLWNKVTMREASRKFDLPFSTLHRYMMQHKHVYVTQMKLLGYTKVFHFVCCIFISCVQFLTFHCMAMNTIQMIHWSLSLLVVIHWSLSCQTNGSIFRFFKSLIIDQ